MKLISQNLQQHPEASVAPVGSVPIATSSISIFIPEVTT